MNDRIQQLAEQCGFRSNPDVYDRNQSFDIPKFAELIVEECCTVLSKETIQHSGYGFNQHGLYQQLRQHFGVKK